MDLDFWDKQEEGLDDAERLDAAAALARAVESEAYRLRVRNLARAKIEAENAEQATLPSPIRLGAFLATPDDPVTHRVAGLWPSGGRVVLSAPHKAGKTTLTGNLIRSLADAAPFLNDFPVVRAGRTVLVDNELDERMLRRWLRSQGVATTQAVDVLPLRGRLSAFNILDPATRTRWAERIGPADVLVLDCLRPALDALNLSEDKDAGRFLEALDELAAEAGIGELFVVHHMGHNGERSRGDSRILDWPDAVWKLVKEKEAEGEEEADARRVYFTAYGRDVDQPEALLTFDPDTRRLAVGGGSRSAQHVETILAAILAYLAEQPAGVSKNAIEEAVEGRRDAIRKALTVGVGWRADHM